VDPLASTPHDGEPTGEREIVGQFILTPHRGKTTGGGRETHHWWGKGYRTLQRQLNKKKPNFQNAVAKSRENPEAASGPYKGNQRTGNPSAMCHSVLTTVVDRESILPWGMGEFGSEEKEEILTSMKRELHVPSESSMISRV